MEPLAELDRFNLDPAVKSELSALMTSLLRQNSEALAAKDAELAEKNGLLEQSTKAIAEKDTKIAALTHELAYYKRIRFGQKAESSARPVPGRRGNRLGRYRSRVGIA